MRGGRGENGRGEEEEKRGGEERGSSHVDFGVLLTGGRDHLDVQHDVFDVACAMRCAIQLATPPLWQEPATGACHGMRGRGGPELAVLVGLVKMALVGDNMADDG